MFQFAKEYHKFVLIIPESAYTAHVLVLDDDFQLQLNINY